MLPLPATEVPPPPPPPFTLNTTILASAFLPILTSHRGVSGMNTTITNCTAAGAAPNPTIHRHAVSLGPNVDSSQPVTYATIWPSVMNSTFVVTSLPLCAAGLTSAMYSGTTKLAAPTPMPMTHRPTTMTATVRARDCTTAPMMKRISA